MPAAIPVIAAVAGGAIAANGSKSAARTQSEAADRASVAQKDIADQQIALEREQFNRVLELTEPLRKTGNAAQNRLAYVLGLADPSSNDQQIAQIRNRLAPQFTQRTEGSESFAVDTYGLNNAVLAELRKDPEFGSVAKGFDEAPPVAETFRFDASGLANDPGYQFELAEGQKALDRAAAAGGRFNSGRAMKDIARFSQGLAATRTQQAYGRARDTYDVNRQGKLTDWTNRLNLSQTNRANRLNPLQSLAGQAQTSANTIGAAGQSFTSGASGALGSYGQGNAMSTLLSGASRAAGQVGVSNALTRALGQGFNGWQNTSAYGNAGNALQAAFSQTSLGQSGFGTGLAYGNEDYGQYF